MGDFETKAEQVITLITLYKTVWHFFPIEVLQEDLYNMQYVEVTETIKWCLNFWPAIALSKKILFL